MKVSKRQVPMDMLSAEQAGKKITVSTNHHLIVVHVWGCERLEQLAYWEFTQPQFCRLFEQLREGIHDSLGGVKP